jgi:hypothetical protein
MKVRGQVNTHTNKIIPEVEPVNKRQAEEAATPNNPRLSQRVRFSIRTKMMKNGSAIEITIAAEFAFP